MIAGDNLFDYDVEDMIEFWRVKTAHHVGSAVAVRDVGDFRLASRYGWSTWPVATGSSGSSKSRLSRRARGVWLDIGDSEQPLAADDMLRRAQGLDERDAYVLEI